MSADGAAVGRLDAVGDRDHEGERLARSGRGLGEHVTAGEHVGDDEVLDGERLLEAALGEGAAHGRRHAEIGEGLQRHWELLAAQGRGRFGETS
jgi:hypothetical protein